MADHEREKGCGIMHGVEKKWALRLCRESESSGTADRVEE